ncbi:MAG TPA: DUF5677 domain-containing protein [Bdellovibrio sp.]|nr:DUF5677 domain-containing protein [Bdellovibrio sp.]
MADSKKFSDFIDVVSDKVREELRSRVENFQPDFKEPEGFSILTALLARQATLMLELLSAPQIWNGHSAPLFLRAMTDVHITFCWILLNPAERAKQYMEHGLGQAVLILEHQKQSMAATFEEDKAQYEELIQHEEAWINSQKWHFMVNVNIGAWSGKTTRVMAEEANILSFYNHAYTPFSQCAHSTWYHVGRYNSGPSDSALQGTLWKAQIADSHTDAWNLHLAAKYLDKTFNIFDEQALKITPQANLTDFIEEKIGEHFFSEDKD